MIYGNVQKTKKKIVRTGWPMEYMPKALRIL
jgi:hypothetical protein